MNRLIFKFSIILVFILFFLFCGTFSGNTLQSNASESSKEIGDTLPISTTKKLYSELHLEKEIPFKAFEQAYTGYQKIKTNKPILTLIDFSKPSTKERMYVLDLNQRKVLFKTHVAHGKNSGNNYTTSFSNKQGSNQSSLGFFLTEKTYQGRNGYSLVIAGLEKNINDKAKDRAVVIHGADYVSPNLIKSMGRLGRSFGCPALPRNINKPIIDAIKGGSVIYAFSEKFNEKYLQESTILSKVKS